VIRQLTALTVAVGIAVLLTQSAAASTDAEMETNAGYFVSICQMDGGTASVQYEFNADGSLASITVFCAGGAGNQTCFVEADGWSSCTEPFTQTPQTPVDSTRPGAGSVGGVQDPAGRGNPVTDPASGPINRNGN
jgi:hypothetical protein